MTDSELNLKLARMIWPDMAWLGSIEHPPREAVYVFGNHPDGPSLTDEFDAIHDGADFDAVLMWVHEAEGTWPAAHAVNDVFVGCLHTRCTWAEFRRAVCEAIVEAGG